ncbi:dTDP-4-amino-4,6-dideoxy-D-galactose acyltransferase [Mannheimia varigena]|uniref:dTDP-4-amino-4,6-dideoxy-D-galactose acyltransferase n=1 Tax=Mannheimia varigena TaxID=85404 RepID=UPI0011062860|nr:dTDP-4-amino-4,6-dideoxy-D-galactose acyltransferase [Mannheimia varigena]
MKADKWLSDFFGREIIQAKVPAEDVAQIEQLQQQGFQFVEGEIEFALELANFSPKMTACTPAELSDLAELKSLFGSAFPNSRFRSPYFSRQENQRFYQKWIETAVKGEFDDICLVQKNAQEQIQGGVTVRLEQHQHAKIGLLAVVPNFQKQGIGSALLHTAASWAKQQNAKQLKIATQTNNLAAIRLYQRAGASIQAVNHWFYFANEAEKRRVQFAPMLLVKI